MVVILLSGVIALLVHGTARTGLDASARQEEYRSTSEAHMIVRELLLDALRHPPQGGGAALNDTLFAIDPAITGSGLPSHALRFLSRGILPPLGGSALWLVTLAPSPEGLRLHAEPASASGAAPLDAVIANTHALKVRVLARTDDTMWSDRWDVTGRVPAAVALDFLSELGKPAAPSLVVHAALDVVR